jgi:hypothetical protein
MPYAHTITQSTDMNYLIYMNYLIDIYIYNVLNNSYMYIYMPVHIYMCVYIYVCIFLLSS